jgi:hypothetical protein
MAEPKIPLLADRLTLPERVMLAGMTQHVGFPVLVKLLEAVVERAQNDVAKIDPEKEPNYERVLAYRQQRFRVVNETANDLLKSIQYHKEMVGQAESDNPNALLDSQLQLQGE